MLRRNGFLVLGVVVLLAIGITGAFARLNDPEIVPGNTFTAGSIDLTVDGQSGSIKASFNADNMDPMLDGESGDDAEVKGGCVALANVGSVPGLLSVRVLRPVSHEDSVWEPEADAGDSAGVQVDPSFSDSVNDNGGNGELWDQLAFQFCLDGNNDGACEADADDTLIYSNYGHPGSDYSTTYNLPLGDDLASGDGIILAPGDSRVFCTDAVWVGDTTDWWWWDAGLGYTNNVAMSDDAEFDIEFALRQVE
jgi:hypothetical protein